MPLLLNALTGKGLQVDRERSRRSIPVHVLPNTLTKQGSAVIPVNYRSPTFFGTWNQYGKGKKKKKQSKKGKGLLTGALGIPQNTSFNRNVWSKIPLLGQII